VDTNVVTATPTPTPTPTENCEFIVDVNSVTATPTPTPTPTVADVVFLSVQQDDCIWDEVYGNSSIVTYSGFSGGSGQYEISTTYHPSITNIFDGSFVSIGQFDSKIYHIPEGTWYVAIRDANDYNNNNVSGILVTACPTPTPTATEIPPTPTPTPTEVQPTPTPTQSLIGAAFIDMLYQNDLTDSYDFRLYQSTSGVTEYGSYISISTVNTLRHIPTTSTSATTSYLIAGVSASISDSLFTRFYRFGINSKLLRINHPSINVFTFNIYGARTTYDQTGTFNVRTSIKHQDIIDQAVTNGVDFNVANAENIFDDTNGLKICDTPNTYVQVGYFTYNASNDTIVFTDLTNHNCTPILSPTSTPTATEIPPTPTPTPTENCEFNVDVTIVTATPTPTATPTSTPTPTPTPSPTATPTATPTPTPTPTVDCNLGASFSEITNSPGPGETSFSFDADYIVLTYQFTNGEDLDTRTRIVSPNIGQTASAQYLGWNRQSQWPTSGTPILRWGGDNRGTGFESVVINIIRFKELYPSETVIVVDMRGWWYQALGTNPVNVAATMYKGGTITGPTNYTFGNTGYSSSTSVESVSKVVTDFEYHQSSVRGERIATLTYNLSTNTGIFNNNDTTTPSA
jgi:hypothetical protein